MKLAVVLLTVLALFLADRLVRVENQRYAPMVGMCTVDPAADHPIGRFAESPDKVQYLYYAVTDHVPPVPLFYA